MIPRFWTAPPVASILRSPEGIPMNRDARGRPPGGLRALLARLTSAGLVLALALAAASAQEPVDAPAAGSVEGLAAAAREHVERGEIFKAIEALQQAVGVAPHRTDLALQLARLEKERGMWLRSADHYRAILNRDPGHVEGRLGYAQLLLADYQFRAAAEQFRLLLSQSLDHPTRDRAQVGLGSAFFAMESYREALKNFQELLDDHPENTTALAYTSLARRKLGDLEGAVNGWRRFLEIHPGMERAEILLQEAEVLRTEITRHRLLLAENPRDAGAQISLGDLLVEKPDLAGAAAAYRAALTAEPGAPPVSFRLGTVLRDQGRCKEAIEVLRPILRDPALGALAAYSLAYCALEVGDSDLELTAWQGALEANHRDAYAYGRYLDALRRADRFREEVGLLILAVERRPADPLPRIQYSMLALAYGRPGDAQRAALDALTLEPNDPLARRALRESLLGRPEDAADLLAEINSSGARDGNGRAAAWRGASVHLVGGAAEKAAGLLEGWLRQNPDDHRSLVFLANCRRFSGASTEEVLSLLSQARDKAPDYLYARLDIALQLNGLGRYRQAAVEAREAVRIAPQNPYTLTALGAALRGAGGRAGLQEAYEALQRAVQVDPMDSTGVARLMLAKVAWQLGHEREARSALRGYLPVDPEEMYRLAWEFVRNQYRDRSFNRQDWSTWRYRFEGDLDTRADALAAIALMVASLDDRATRLRSSDQTARLFFTPRSVRVERDGHGRTTMSSRTVKTETLDENVGYVAVTNMADPKLVSEVEGAMEEMKKRDAVILDLRGNPGGAEPEVDQITSMLVEPGKPTGSIITSNGVEKKKSQGEKPPVLPEKPVVVLVDRNTASSAEVLAGALQETRRAVIVGETTYGKAGIQIPHLLPDGTTLLVASGLSGDASGVSFAGAGIEPDVRIDGAVPTGEGVEDPAILKARELLRKSRPGREPAREDSK